MANRFFNQFRKTLVKEQVSIFAKVTFGASGAPTLVAAQSKGIKSIARNSAGTYTVTFGQSGATVQLASAIDKYPLLLAASHKFLLASGGPAAPLMHFKAVTPTSGTCQLVFMAVDGTTATDPASGEAVYLSFDLANSSAI